MVGQRWYFTLWHSTDILALIQQPASISNCFLGIKKHKLEELLMQMSTWK